MSSHAKPLSCAALHTLLDSAYFATGPGPSISQTLLHDPTPPSQSTSTRRTRQPQRQGACQSARMASVAGLGLHEHELSTFPQPRQHVPWKRILFNWSISPDLVARPHRHNRPVLDSQSVMVAVSQRRRVLWRGLACMCNNSQPSSARIHVLEAHTLQPAHLSKPCCPTPPHRHIRPVLASQSVRVAVSQRRWILSRGLSLYVHELSTFVCPAYTP